ncbi:MAG: dynamin family protein [Intrasporangiaceae bacterium]|nr:dynamin family protein [Intrasporangiaceae bacterium]
MSYATTAERAALEQLERRWDARRLRVLVAGEAKRGKSSLINALLEREILPTGVTPLTSVTTTVSALGEGAVEHVTVQFGDGSRIDAPLAELAAFVTEAANPDNTRDVRDVTVRVDSPLLSAYALDLVDTPGIGSVYAHNTVEAHAAFAQLDAAVLVLSVDPPITAAERDLLGDILIGSVRTFVVVNKADRFTTDEVEESLAFTRAVCLQLAGEDLVPRACSVLRGADDPGFSAFRRELLEYLAQRGGADVRVALAGHTRRALSGMREHRRVERRSLELAASGEAETLASLRATLVAISGQGSEISDHVVGSLRRLRRELDASAVQAVTFVAAEVRTSFDRHWQESLVSAPVREVEGLARTVIFDDLAAAVDSWRHGEAARLEEELSLLAARTFSETEARIASARDAVAQALDVAWSADEAAVSMPVDTRFRYDFSPAVGWAPPLEGLVFALRTPFARRRHIQQAARATIAPLTDRQVGRARSDLQGRLDKTGRALAVRLEQRLEETVERMVAMLERALSDQSREERRRRWEHLAAEESALDALLEQADAL